MSARSTYLKELEKRLDLPGRYKALWEPHSLCRLGDVGRTEDGDWQRTGDSGTRQLGDLGAPITGASSPVSFTAGESIEIKAAIRGSTEQGFEFIGEAAAGVKFSFGRSESVVLIAPDTAYSQLPDDNAVAHAMVEAWQTGRMAYGDQVVVGVCTASTGAVLASAEGGAKVDATSDVTLSTGAIDVAQITGSLGIARQSQMSYARSFPNGFVLAYRTLVLTQEGVWSPHPVAHADLVEMEKMPKFDTSEHDLLLSIS